MSRCRDCHKQVRGELHADILTPPVVVVDATLGGGLVVADVELRLLCPYDEEEIVGRMLEVEELFEHSPCRPSHFLVRDARVRAREQMIPRPDKRSSRRWLGADITVFLQCPSCQRTLQVSVTVGEYAQTFLAAA